VIGCLTLLVAGTIGLVQTDLKRVIAYSTMSQIGYMIMGVSAGAYFASMFHLATHAFFKALLFMGAGSVIHGCHEEQDIRRMGGLKKALPVTFITMLLGTIAISGVPGFSGFFSKDEMLAHTYEYSPAIWLVGSVTSILTAFYMFRLMFLTFYGHFRGTHEQEHHLHESPKSMTIPLVVLAILSVVGGFLGLPEFWGTHNWIGEFLKPVAGESTGLMSHEKEWMLMGIASVAAIATIYCAYVIYRQRRIVPVEHEKDMAPLQRVVYHKYYIDELYDNIIRKPLDLLAGAYNYVDKHVVDNIVNGVGTAVDGLSGVVRRVQTGNIGFYILGMVAGIIIILFFTFIK
jgi:NADH-quinone oxidoreductase subunit L